MDPIWQTLPIDLVRYINAFKNQYEKLDKPISLISCNIIKRFMRDFKCINNNSYELFDSKNYKFQSFTIYNKLSAKLYYPKKIVNNIKLVIPIIQKHHQK
jgi:hypothetical protein